MVQDVTLDLVLVQDRYLFLQLGLFELLVFQQLVSYHKTLVVSLANRLLYLLIVCLNGKIHRFDPRVDFFIDLKRLLFLQEDSLGHVCIDGH